MPITCPIDFGPLTTEEFAELDYRVMAHAFDCHNELGCLADENIYQRDLVARVQAAGWEVQGEIPVAVAFAGFSKTYYLDTVIGRKALYELKTAAMLGPEHEAQLMNYLLLLDRRRGKLINFRSVSVESRFVNAPLSRDERRSFKVMDHSWSGRTDVRDMVVDLLRDWGTGLGLPLYRQAIMYLIGGDGVRPRQLPMCRDGIDLGCQRFDTMDESSGLRVTAFERPSASYGDHLARLIALSPLRAMHWINIARAKVTFTTIA